MIGEVVRVCSRWRWLIVVPLVVVFALPSMLGLAVGRTYVSEGSIQVEPNDILSPVVQRVENPDRTRLPIDDLLEHTKQTLVSRTYLETIASRAGEAAPDGTVDDSTVERFRKGFEVFNSGPSALVLRFRARSPELARDGAEAALQLLLELRTQRVTENAESAVKFFEAQAGEFQVNFAKRSEALKVYQEQHPEAALDTEKKTILNQLAQYRAELGQIRTSLAEGKGDASRLREREAELLTKIEAVSVPVGATPDVELELFRLTAERDEAQQSLQEALTRVNESRLLAGVQRERVTRDRIVDTPRLPSSPSWGRAVTLAALSLIVALALAGSLVLLAEHVDPRVRRTGDVVESAGIPVLSVVSR